MRFSRREFGRLTLAGVPGVALATRSGGLLDAFAQAKPNSLINGVQIGTITYSYRSMPDQSAEATLKYILDSGHQRDRADGRTGRELRRRADGGRARWRWRARRARRLRQAAPAAGGGACGCASRRNLPPAPRSGRGTVSRA